MRCGRAFDPVWHGVRLFTKERAGNSIDSSGGWYILKTARLSCQSITVFRYETRRKGPSNREAGENPALGRSCESGADVHNVTGETWEGERTRLTLKPEDLPECDAHFTSPDPERVHDRRNHRFVLLLHPAGSSFFFALRYCPAIAVPAPHRRTGREPKSGCCAPAFLCPSM